ncbi:MAG TPA: hypothetical protein VFS21_24300 [Roseiflexaceae bacterium]|nr:hypothetical protein [Roseiflexaceae bacterium]
MTSMDNRRTLIRLTVLVLGLGLSASLLLVVGVRLLLGERGGQAVVATSTRTVVPPSPTPVPTAQPTPTPQPSPASTATPSFRFGTALISDTLVSPAGGALGEGNAEAAEYRFAGDAYRISVKPAAYLAWSPLEDTYDDAAVEVGVRLLSGPPPTAFGIIFRFQDEDNFYFYNITADGYYALDMKKNGRWSALLDWARLPGGGGRERRLRVELAGERMRLFLDGTLLDETSDDNFRRGRIALAVNTFDQGDAVVAFRNLLLQNKAAAKDQP